MGKLFLIAAAVTGPGLILLAWDSGQGDYSATSPGAVLVVGGIVAMAVLWLLFSFGAFTDVMDDLGRRRCTAHGCGCVAQKRPERPPPASGRLWVQFQGDAWHRAGTSGQPWRSVSGRADPGAMARWASGGAVRSPADRSASEAGARLERRAGKGEGAPWVRSGSRSFRDHTLRSQRLERQQRRRPCSPAGHRRCRPCLKPAGPPSRGFPGEADPRLDRRPDASLNRT